MICWRCKDYILLRITEGTHHRPRFDGDNHDMSEICCILKHMAEVTNHKPRYGGDKTMRNIFEITTISYVGDISTRYMMEFYLNLRVGTK